MIPILIALLFLGGSTSYLLEAVELYQDRAKVAVADDDRRAQVKAVLKSMVKTTKGQHKAVKHATKQVKKLLKDKDVSDEQLDMVWATYEQAVETYHREITDERFELKQYVNREEWQAIFAAPPSDSDT